MLLRRGLVHIRVLFFQLVMDLKSVGLVSDNQQVKGKELEEFSRKISLLTEKELSVSLSVSQSEVFKVLNQSVPCVGCRRRLV